MPYMCSRHGNASVPVQQEWSRGSTFAAVTGKYFCIRHGHGEVDKFISFMYPCSMHDHLFLLSMHGHITRLH